jgi:ubiquitin carboxyl-terminal hydrolase 5/13
MTLSIPHLDTDVICPEDINLNEFLAAETGEETLPDEGPKEEEFNQEYIEQLMSMGFSLNRCKRALLASGNNNVEVAMNWIFEHMDDPNIDDPLEAKGSFPPESVDMLTSMGFTSAQATKALTETQGNVERAVDWLFSHQGDIEEDAPASTSGNSNTKYRLKAFISHKGTSMHCGHYVAHVKVNDRWILFNDNRVVLAAEVPIAQGYVYFYEQI